MKEITPEKILLRQLQKKNAFVKTSAIIDCRGEFCRLIQQSRKQDSFKHDQLVCIKVQVQNFSEPPLKYDQGQTPWRGQGWL